MANNSSAMTQTAPIATDHVLVGLSGGVDSSVTAFILQEQGYKVTGLFMKNWEEDDTQTFCHAAVDMDDASKVCERLNIPLDRINFAAEYWDEVFTLFLEEYKNGRTPNPDILCNQEIKFKYFLNFALSQGAQHLATGHYARKDFVDGRYRLLRGLDKSKDQSYFLYTLTQDRLSRVLFPVGELQKTQVRDIAAKIGLANHDKKDSTGICFIGERRFKTFLSTYLPSQPGKMMTPNGKVVGQHDGLMYYTLGQRQGLKIGGTKDSTGEPWYVVGKDLKANLLYVVQGMDHPWHYSTTLIANACTWVSGHWPEDGLRCTAKVRYRQTDQACTVMRIPAQSTDTELTSAAQTCLQVEFDEPQTAVTPGQSVVLYLGEECLGGGIIMQTNSPGGLRVEAN